MVGDSPDVGTSDDDDDDVRQVCRSGGCERSNRGYRCCCRQILSVCQWRRGSPCPIFTVWGGGVVASLLLAAEAHAAKGNVGDEESEEDNDGSSSSGGGKR